MVQMMMNSDGTFVTSTVIDLRMWQTKEVLALKMIVEHIALPFPNYMSSF